jgi:hypothetical protein
MANITSSQLAYGIAVVLIIASTNTTTQTTMLLRKLT